MDKIEKEKEKRKKSRESVYVVIYFEVFMRSVGHDEVVNQLISAGANQNARDFDGNTPFILAHMNHHPATARLVDAGDNDVPDAQWLVDKAKADRAAAMARSQRDMSPSGTLMQAAPCSVFVFVVVAFAYLPFLSPIAFISLFILSFSSRFLTFFRLL